MKNKLHEIEGVEGFFRFQPQKIMYKFWYDSNFAYCEDYNKAKIVKIKRWSDEDDIRYR